MTESCREIAPYCPGVGAPAQEAGGFFMLISCKLQEKKGKFCMFSGWKSQKQRTWRDAELRSLTGHLSFLALFHESTTENNAEIRDKFCIFWLQIPETMLN